MVDAVNTVGGTSGAQAAPSVRAPAAATVVAAATVNSGGSNQASVLSNRLFDDPLAGVLVTEQLDNDGQIIQQNPTSSVLAYLRNGLTINGLPKQTTVA